MTDPHARDADDGDFDPGPDGEATGGTPRWVKIFGLVVAGLVLLFVIVQFVGDGGHGPGRHGGGGEPAPTDVTGDVGHAPPPGVDHGPPQP